MKRVPLNRKVGFKRQAPKARTRKPVSGLGSVAEPVKVRKAIPQESAGKKREKADRRALMKRLVAAGVVCEVCPELARHGIVIPGGCSGFSEIHERRKRSSAGTVEHAPNLLPICRMANGWIEDSTGEDSARDRFSPWLVLRPEHAEWADCGRRRDEAPVPVVVKLCAWCGAAYVTVPPSGLLPCGHEAALAA